MVCLLVCLLDWMSPAYSALNDICFSPSSPTTTIFRITRNAVILADSSALLDDQTSAAALTNDRRNLRSGKKYGINGMVELSINFWVAESVSVGSRCRRDDE